MQCAQSLALCDQRQARDWGSKFGLQCPLWVISGHLQCKKPCPLYPRKRTLPATSSASSASKRLPARQSRGWRRRSSVAELDGLLRPDPLQDRRAWSGRPCCSLSCCFSFHEVLVVAVLDPALFSSGVAGRSTPRSRSTTQISSLPFAFLWRLSHGAECFASIGAASALNFAGS